MDGLCKKCNADFIKLSKRKDHRRNKDHTLCKTAERGHVDCLMVIIRAGADVNNDGAPLTLAAEKGHYACIEALLEAGADVNHENSRNALQTVATHISGKKCFDLLIKAGADVNTVTSRYPLITWVSRYAGPGYMNALIKEGADVNAIDIYGNTPLMFTSRFQVIHNNLQNHFKNMKLLLRAEASVNICNKDGHNALTRLIMLTDNRKEHHLVRNVYMVKDVYTVGGVYMEKDVHMVLFAAGEQIIETVDSRHLADALDQKIPIPDYLLNEDLKLCLKHMCREAVRKHLLQMSNLNLFCRIPGFTFPPHLREYLVYHVSIDDAVKPVYHEKSGLIAAYR